jgi:hypothetical protein
MRIGYLTRTGRLDDSVAEAYSATVSALAAEGAELVATTTEVVQHARSLSLLRMLTESGRLYGDAVTAIRWASDRWRVPCSPLVPRS